MLTVLLSMKRSLPQKVFVPSANQMRVAKSETLNLTKAPNFDNN